MVVSPWVAITSPLKCAVFCASSTSSSCEWMSTGLRESRPSPTGPWFPGNRRTATAPRNATRRDLVFMVMDEACTDPVGVLAVTGSLETTRLSFWYIVARVSRATMPLEESISMPSNSSSSALALSNRPCLALSLVTTLLASVISPLTSISLIGSF